MSSETGPGAARGTQGTGTANQAGSPRIRTAGQAWLLIRITGLLLSLLVLGHLLAVHVLTDVAQTTSSFVLRRWSAALWVAWDACMLTAALLHGAAGVWTVLREHLSPGGGRNAAAAVLGLLVVALAVLGWYTIVVGVSAALAAG